MIRLRVWANARPMGWFGHAASDYFFEYDPQWLEQSGQFVLAPQFPLGAQRFTGAAVRTFRAYPVVTPTERQAPLAGRVRWKFGGRGHPLASGSAATPHFWLEKWPLFLPGVLTG